MIRKILVYEDALADTHPALDRAIQLAQQSQVELKVVDIVDGHSDSLREFHRPMRSLVEQERKERLYAICEQLHENKIDFKMELIHGRPFIEIVREVVHDGFHLVIKSAAKTNANHATGLMGPVDMRLVRNCPCPVWLETPQLGTPSKQVLVAVDPQNEDDELNDVLLDMGASLAKAAGRELQIIAAWQVPDEDFLVGRMKLDRLAKYTEDIQAAAQQSLDALLVRAGKPVLPNGVHFHKGEAAATVLDCVNLHKPDVLVMGTVGHTGVRGLLIGNTTDTVLRHINRSILTVKPASLFRS